MMDLRFTFELWLLRGLHYRLFFAAAIIVFVSLLAGLVVFLLDPGFEDAGDAVWWSFLRLSDPGYLGDDPGVVSVTISTIVTVLGYVLFLGLLVAILKSNLEDRWDDRAVVLRIGSPLKLDGLEGVAFNNAVAVILPGAGTATALYNSNRGDVTRCACGVEREVELLGQVP